MHNIEFKEIPDNSSYLIDKSGTVINKLTESIVPQFVYKNTDRPMVNIRNNAGDKRMVSVAYLLAKTHIPLPTDISLRNARVAYRDNNNKNVSIDNLYWIDRGSNQIKHYATRLDNSRKKHNVPHINDKKGSIECVDKPGYYYIPNSDHPLVIDICGNVFNLESNLEVKQYVNGAGYLGFTLRTNGINKMVSTHRVMANMFIHAYRDTTGLEVNHIDGNKINNHLNNLEWVTPSQNTKHAYTNFLHGQTNVLARHILNETIIRYPNMAECAREYKLKINRFSRHLKSKFAGTVTKNWYVFKLDNGEPWPELKAKQIERDSWNVIYGVWYAKHTDGTSLMNNTLEGLCGTIPLPYAPVQNFITDNKDKPYRGWTIWYDDSPREEVIKSLPDRVKRVFKPPTSLTFTNLGTGETMEFASIVKAGKHFNTDEKNIIYALDKRNGVFRNYKVVRNIINKIPSLSEG